MVSALLMENSSILQKQRNKCRQRKSKRTYRWRQLETFLRWTLSLYESIKQFPSFFDAILSPPFKINNTPDYGI